MNNHFWVGKRVLVTGGAGFIGSWLVKELVKEGAIVQVVDNLWRGSLRNLEDEEGRAVIDLKARFVHADLSDPAKADAEIANVDCVYHLADVIAGIDYVFNHERFVYQQNILINTNVLSACIKNQIGTYIYVGTACSFPKHLQMQDGITRLREEDTYPAEPESGYGWSKLMGEYEAGLASADGLSVGLLRFHNVYGPRCVFDKTRSQVLPALVRKAICYPHEEFVVWGSGTQYRDFVYVDDAVRALLLVAQRGMGAGVIQIGSETPVTIREAAEEVVRLSNKPIVIRYDTTKPEGDRGRVAVCDRARAILGWTPQVSFKDGLSRLYRSIEAELARGQANDEPDASAAQWP